MLHYQPAARRRRDSAWTASSWNYRAPRWLPGGHLQTIYPATCIAKPRVAYRRERWDAPDGDFVDIDFVDGQPGQPLVRAVPRPGRLVATATTRAR